MPAFTLGNGPKLAAAAAVLNIAGATPDAKATTLRDAVASFSAANMNEFLDNFTNKVLVSSMWKHMKFKDPFTAAFIKEGISVAGATEHFASKILTPKKFDPSKRFQDDQSRAKNLNIVFHTVLREFITNTVSLAGVRAAFASETAFGEWFSEQTALLSESMQIRLYDFMQTQILTGIENILYTGAIGADKWDERFIEINKISKNMEIPSVKYNLGFKDPTDVKNKDDVRRHKTSRDNLYFMATTDVVNAVEGKVSAVKFHNAYFDIKKYKGTLLSDQLGDDEVVLIDESAARGYFRVNEVASNTWAGNLTLETYLHYWIVFGMIPWATAVRIKFIDHP